MAVTVERPARVSVVIPTKNRAPLLRQALASVEALRGPDLDIEIIVSDNGSTDDTPAVVEEFGARLVTAAIPGAASARNAGLRAASGEFIAFLDDDDVWLPGHLRGQIAMLRDRPDLGAVIGQAMTTDMDLHPTSVPWSPAPQPNGDMFASILQTFPQIGATVVRAEAVRSVGCFDEKLLSDEDWDWHLRLALGHRIGVVPVPCVLFRQRPAGSRDELNWMRFPYLRHVFWKHVRGAPGRRPGLARCLRTYVRLTGGFAHHFLASAAVHAADGNAVATRRSLIRAARTSLPHTVRALIREPEIRQAVRLAALPRFRHPTGLRAGDTE